MKIAEMILDTLTEPVLLLNGDRRAVLANPAFYQTLNVASGQLTGKPVQKLVNGVSGDLHVGTLLESGDVENVELVCTVPPGTRVVFYMNSRRILIGDELTEMIVIELRDITREKDGLQRIQELYFELRQRSKELEESQRELESFTHSVSHDLRTPLRLNSRIGELLLEEYERELPAGAKVKVRMMLDSIEGMGELIENLLLMSKMKYTPLKKRRVDMERLAREAIAELREELQGRVVEIVIEELPPGKVERTLYKQVLVNLIANALKFTRPRERAEIRVGFMRQDDETVYFVRDNGVGFDMNQADSIFQTFRRLHKEHEFEGSGIGLALVERIVDYHGGRIWAESKINQGTTIYFTLGEETAG